MKAVGFDLERQIGFMEPPYDSRKIANRLIEIARENGNSMSIMRVLKLACLAQSWSPAIFEKPFVNDFAHAWKYGPVIPSINFSFRPYGIYKLNPIPLVQEIEIDRKTGGLLASVYNLYRHLSANRLAGLTHIRDGPCQNLPIQIQNHP